MSTYGRGLNILDDITPLEQGGPVTTDDARLYAPRPTYRFSRNGNALINYSVKAAPDDMVRIEIVDRRGNIVRRLRADAKAGFNRVPWDLRYDPPRLVALRTTPPENPHIWEEPRFRGRDTRPVTHWGLSPAEVGPIVPPGQYTVRLTVDGKSHTQPIQILRDPKIASTDEDLESSVLLQLRIRDAISDAADMINAIEVMRKQLEDVQNAWRSDETRRELLNSVGAMDKRLLGVETRLLEPAQMTSDDKYFQQAYRVYMNLLWLNGEVGPGAGDVAGGTDFRPTDTSLAVFETIDKDLNTAKIEYKTLMEKEVPAFNRAVAERGIAPLVAKP